MFINTACMAPPWFNKATSCCFGFLTGTRAPLFSLTNFRLVAILTNLPGVRKNRGLNKNLEARLCKNKWNVPREVVILFDTFLCIPYRLCVRHSLGSSRVSPACLRASTCFILFLNVLFLISCFFFGMKETSKINGSNKVCMYYFVASGE